MIEKTHICDQVDSRDLLHHLSTHTQKCAVEKALWSILKDESEGSLARSYLLFSNGLRNFLHVNSDDSVLFINFFGIIVQSPDNMTGLVFVSVLDELDPRVSSQSA